MTLDNNVKMIFHTNDIDSTMQFPCFFLYKHGWNDYWEYKTTYSIFIYLDASTYNSIGNLKILDKRQGNTSLEEEFTQLDDNFCSLGVDMEYYQKVKELFPDTYNEILDALNDAAVFPTVAESFENEPGFKISLLRFAAAEKAYREAKFRLLDYPVETPFKFDYTCKLPGAGDKHSVKFNFIPYSQVPNRIVALVGKNGTGKTQYLSNLALDLSGQRATIEERGEFLPFRPSFSKVIAVSYSVFDKFSRPSVNKSFSYKYCGLRDSKGLITGNKLQAIYQESVALITSSNRQRIWFNALSNIIDSEILQEFYDNLFFENKIEEALSKGKLSLSSGQSMVMYVTTEIIAHIREESLILFDEPEMHLHPHAIANIIRTLHSILVKFNSYAIIATHSPLILQEIPSNNVFVFEREGNIPIIRQLDIESFGESPTILMQHVFETQEVLGTYKDFLKQQAKILSLNEVNQLFDGKLSFNAKLFLKTCYNEELN